MLFRFFMIFLLIACDSKKGKAEQNQASANLEKVSIGRLICGGHLPLAVVEKIYQGDLKTFQLNTVQNQSWDNVIKDMSSGKLAGTFILSPLAMNLIHEGFPGKIVFNGQSQWLCFIVNVWAKTPTESKTTH